MKFALIEYFGNISKSRINRSRITRGLAVLSLGSDNVQPRIFNILSK